MPENLKTSIRHYSPNKDTRVDADSAGYEELDGAVKDADCKVVKVKDGISNDKGCCCLWKRKGQPEYFQCGTCIYTQSK